MLVRCGTRTVSLRLSGRSRSSCCCYVLPRREGSAPASVLPRTLPEPAVLEEKALDERKASSLKAEPSGGNGGDSGAFSAEGYIELVFVTLLWGSYNPAVRHLYNEHPFVDPSTLTFIRSALSATALTGSAVVGKLLQYYSSRTASNNQYGDSAGNSSSSSNGSGAMNGNGSISATSSDSDSTLPAKQATSASNTAAAAAAGGAFLAQTSDSVLLAGMELGFWNFLATALQASGLQLTSATRAGFLVQLTAALTPVVARLAGVAVPPRVWAAVVLGIAGSCLVAYDGMQTSEVVAGAVDSTSGNGLVISGETYLLLSCVFYSLATVRLGLFSPKMKSINLAAVKKTSLTIFSLAWLALVQWQAGSVAEQAVAAGNEAAPGLLQNLQSLPLPAWILIIYTGLGPGAAATYMQTHAQASVPATQAQVIFSLTPLWSALFAYLTLGDEGMGPMAWAGGAAIVIAGLVATGVVGKSAKKQQE